jgi:hypothetical protein
MFTQLNPPLPVTALEKGSGLAFAERPGSRRNKFLSHLSDDQ